MCVCIYVCMLGRDKKCSNYHTLKQNTCKSSSASNLTLKILCNVFKNLYLYPVYVNIKRACSDISKLKAAHATLEFLFETNKKTIKDIYKHVLEFV